MRRRAHARTKSLIYAGDLMRIPYTKSVFNGRNLIKPNASRCSRPRVPASQILRDLLAVLIPEAGLPLTAK